MAVDHVYPSSMGGGNNIHNLVPACDRCNSSKANLDPWEWMTAAGVPAIRQASIGRVIHLPAVTTGLQVPEERIILDYQAPKALKRPFQGIKGS